MISVSEAEHQRAVELRNKKVAQPRLPRLPVIYVPLDALDHIQTQTDPPRLARVRELWAEVRLEPIHLWLTPDHSILLRDGNHRLTVSRERGVQFLPALVHWLNAKGVTWLKENGRIPA